MSLENFETNLAVSDSLSRARRGRSVRIKTKGASGSKGGEKILIDHYQLGEKIGKGAFGAVYQGLDTLTGGFVAIKRVPRRKGLDETQLKNEMAFLKTFKHENIVKYIDLIVTDNNVNIILEYVESGSLAQVIEKFGVIPENLAAIYVEQVLKGLNYLHQNGVVHRDIKGPNLLITKNGVVKLADFGIAMMTKVKDCERIRNTDSRSDSNSESELTAGEASGPPSTNKADSLGVPVGIEAEEWTIVEGSPFWMAPEIIQMNRPTTACDIWSLGCTVIELLTGSPPYYEMPPLAALYKVVKEERPPFPDSITPECESFLELCFQKDPAKRPSAAALLQHPWIQKNVLKEDREKSGDERRLERHIKRVSQHNMDLEILNNENWLRIMAEKFGDPLPPEFETTNTNTNTNTNVVSYRTTHSESEPGTLQLLSHRSNSGREKHKSDSSTIKNTSSPSSSAPVSANVASANSDSSPQNSNNSSLHQQQQHHRHHHHQHRHSKEPSELMKQPRKLSSERESHRSLNLFKEDNGSPTSTSSPTPPTSSTMSTVLSSGNTDLSKKHEKRNSNRDPKHTTSTSLLTYEGLMVVVVDYELRKNLLFRYVVYILKIYTKEKSWVIARSFTEMKELHEKLEKLYKDKIPPLPPHKTWKGLETSYLDQKRLELQRYFEILLRVVDVTTNKDFLQFISQTKHDIKQPDTKP
jgi:serine/threonine protein kinase